jgi:hypothetical protein
MNKKAATLVQAFTALSPKEQAEVIDLIAEYYLARPKHRQALLQKVGNGVSPPAPVERGREPASRPLD